MVSFCFPASHEVRREGRISVCVMEYVAKGEFSIASWSVSQREIRLRAEHVAEGVNPTPYEAHREGVNRLRVERIATGMSLALHESYREESKDLLRESLKLIRKDRYV